MELRVHLIKIKFWDARIQDTKATKEIYQLIIYKNYKYTLEKKKKTAMAIAIAGSRFAPVSPTRIKAPNFPSISSKSDLHFTGYEVY